MNFFGAGPDPATMSCAEIERGYKLNQQAAKTRSGSHKKDAAKRVKELEPFLQRCQQTGLPVGPEEGDIAARVDQYGGSTGAVTPFQQVGPIPMAMQSAVYPGGVAVQEGMGMGDALKIALLLAAAGGLVWFVIKKSGKKTATAVDFGGGI